MEPTKHESTTDAHSCKGGVMTRIESFFFPITFIVYAVLDALSQIPCWIIYGDRHKFARWMCRYFNDLNDES